ncbi:cinnamoyl- reductase [Trichoderma arundinaceum]|uniref:Cinnamoyl-reductase n=1 Tax=Trichoderma arundinaceum TaxID=490622 RepID=A0A395N8I7_TRIAR|nr:cinnamoyl- reductase [Trichoderma arundinaceum]
MASTILVTGGSGFAAAHIIRAFLNKGYNVKATVRSEKRGKKSLQAIQNTILFRVNTRIYLYRSGLEPCDKKAVVESNNAILAYLAYLASKSFAEKAAFDFVKENKPKFTISALCPPFIYGPLLHHVESPKELNTSSNDIYRLFNGSEKEVPPTAFWSYVDVRDLAEAHVLAFEKSAAANQRYLIAASAYSYQQICDIIRAKFPELRDTTSKGETGAPLPPVYRVDTTKANNDLGVKYRSLEDTIGDTVNSLRSLEKA